MISRLESNTPLRHPPADYCPAGSERWFSIAEGPDAGKKMFYYDHSSGNGPAQATVVFVHGNPENSYTYRHIRDALLASGKRLRLIAMDHIGFGLSDQATFEMVDVHHSANLLQFIRELDLSGVTLVVHDWGGPIGIGAFIKDSWRVNNLLVMNSTIFPMPDDGFTYTNFPLSWLPWCKVPRYVPDALWGGVASYVVSHGAPQGTARILANLGKYLFLHGLRMIPKESPEYVWAESLRSKANTRSSKRNVYHTPFWGRGYSYHDPVLGEQDNYALYANIQAYVPKYWGPEGEDIGVCGYFGQWDACGKQSVIDQWHEALPQMADATHVFPDIGHFIEEYKGKEMAHSILEMNGLQSSANP